MIVTEEIPVEILEKVKEKFNLIPYYGRIYVMEKKMSEKIGSLYIPENQKEIIVTEGYVIAIGEDVNFCKVGDLVFYARYSGAKCEWLGQEYRVMNEEDLLGRRKD